MTLATSGIDAATRGLWMPNVVAFRTNQVHNAIYGIEFTTQKKKVAF